MWISSALISIVPSLNVFRLILYVALEVLFVAAILILFKDPRETRFNI